MSHFSSNASARLAPTVFIISLDDLSRARQRHPSKQLWQSISSLISTTGGREEQNEKDFLICSSLDLNSSAIETSGGFVCSVVQMQSYSAASWSGGGFLIGPRHNCAHFGILNDQLAKAARNFVLDSAIKLIPWKCGKDFFLALLNLHKAKAGALKLTFHSKTSRASSWQIPDFSAITLRKIKIKI